MIRNRAPFGLLALLLWRLVGPAVGQALPAPGDEFKETAVKVYLDCGVCDLTYIKTEITFVNYVRDRTEAQVHVLVTVQDTGSGGREYTLTFLGQRSMTGQDDVLRYCSNRFDTEDDRRRGLVQTLKLGLMRYVARTPIARRVAISLLDRVDPTSVADPWHSWVFSLSGRGYANGQESVRYHSLTGNLSANRVTPAWKIRMSLAASHYLNRFEIDGQTVESSLRSRRLSGLAVRSLNEHWSVGAYFSLTSSSYANIRSEVNPAPAVEFDLFPYSQTTRRQLRFLYRLNFSAVRYREETIYLKTRESLWNESLTVSLEIKEKWGTISSSLEGAHYFHDLGKSRLNLSGEVSLRIYKGLSFDIYGGGSRIRDQLSLPRAGASYEDILLMRKQLATSYEYFFSVGLSYAFGSVFSNVVNPRFGEGGLAYGLY